MAQTLESLLTQRYQAVGRGLHEKLDSVEADIPEQARKQIRFVASFHNMAVNEDAKLADENLEAAKRAYRSALAELDGQELVGSQGAPDETVSNYGTNYGSTAGLAPVSDSTKPPLSQPSAPQDQPQSPPKAVQKSQPNRRDKASKRRRETQQRIAADARKRTRFLLLVVAGLFAIVVMLVLQLLVTLTKSKTAQPQQAPAAQAPVNPGDAPAEPAPNLPNQ